MSERVSRIKGLIQTRLRLFQPVLRGTEGWYKGLKANFTIDIPTTEIDPDWVRGFVKEAYYPEVWLHKKKNLYTLRVPHRYKEKVTQKIRWIGFRYHSEKRLWVRKKRFNIFTRRAYG